MVCDNKLVITTMVSASSAFSAGDLPAVEKIF